MTNKAIIEERSIIIKDFEKKFVRGTPPYDIPGGHGIQEAEAWVEADIEELEDWIWGQLTLAEAKGFSKGSNEMYFQTRKKLPVSYQKGLKEGQEKARKEFLGLLASKEINGYDYYSDEKEAEIFAEGYETAINSLKQSQEEDLCHCHGNDPTHELGEYKIHCKHCEQFQDTEEK